MASDPQPFCYHAFLSFRGRDTRKNFADHLYTALVNAGFHTFRDDPELETGEDIKEGLKKAIKQSQSSVIVFSKDYTSSRWCLDELIMILELKRTSNHVVIPVYYDIKPAELRHQEVIPKYQETQSLEKLNGWRAALEKVADLSGMILGNEEDGYEARFIQKIVTKMHEKLGRVPLSEVQKELEDKVLLFIYAVIDVAEGKQLKLSTTVRPWFHKLKEAVFDAEDLSEDIKTEVLRQEMEPESGSSTSDVREFISSPPSHAFDTALIYHKIEEAVNKLDTIMEQRRDVLGMEASATYRESQVPLSTSLPEECVYGRDEEKEIFTSLSLSDDQTNNNIVVIPIVSMGGIGKTTLARFLYNDVRVEQHFDLMGLHFKGI